MNPSRHRCDSDQLLRYHDGELPPRQAQEVSNHLAQCAHCRQLLNQQAQIRQAARQAAETAAAQTPRPDVEGRLLGRIQAHGRGNAPGGGFWRPRRWIPVGALALMALLAALVIVNPWQPPVQTAQPSAIVESFQGNVSTVMILETQTTGQTIVWFEEINELNGETDGDQDAPPAGDRNAHPAADRHWRRGNRA